MDTEKDSIRIRKNTGVPEEDRSNHPGKIKVKTDQIRLWLIIHILHRSMR
jgi:hypothetical protein